MKKKERAKFIREVLEKLFPDPPIPLAHKDPYTLLIAVLLSAQCTDKRVNATTPSLFKMADNPRAMAQLPLEEIERIIRPCGLGPSKARSIKGLSKILLEKYHGEIPKTREDLESLPGVGRKTASVVLAQAFKIPAFPVDTHIHRCAKRWKLSQGRTIRQTEEDLKKVFPKQDWIKLHLQIIYYAREYCPALGHKVEKCPICRGLRKN
ncbi:MAG: endonuclease III [Simkaniaceae bacterium]